MIKVYRFEMQVYFHCFNGVGKFIMVEYMSPEILLCSPSTTAALKIPSMYVY